MFFTVLYLEHTVPFKKFQTEQMMIGAKCKIVVFNVCLFYSVVLKNSSVSV